MIYKLNIIEPWDSGTESAIDASIVKEGGKQFLLFLGNPVKVKGQDAQYFVCELQNQEDKNDLKKHKKKVYPINMVFDSNVNENSELFPLSSYRASFLSGELII